MYTINLTESSLKDLLQLGKAAQLTINIILEQSNGQHQVTIDRAHYSNADKQKLKNGLKELRDKKLISKLEGSQNTYLIDNTRIQFIQEKTLEKPAQPLKVPSIPKDQDKPSPCKAGNKSYTFSTQKISDKIEYNNRVAESKEKIAKDNAEWAEQFWSGLQKRVSDGTHRLHLIIEANYTEVPGCDTKSIQSACTEFIEEITNPIYFYDIENRIKHNNELYNRFKSSVLFYTNKRTKSDKTNLLVEVDKLISLAKHNEQCIELSKNGKKCTCLDDSHNKLNTLLNEDIDDFKMDPGSKPEAKVLRNQLREKLSETYPELLI
jgi:hypothetical protein